MIINLKRGWFGRHTHWVSFCPRTHQRQSPRPWHCTVRLLKHIDANLYVLGFVRLLVHVRDDEIIWGPCGLDIVVLYFPLSPHTSTSLTLDSEHWNQISIIWRERGWFGRHTGYPVSSCRSPLFILVDRTCINVEQISWSPIEVITL